VSFRALAEVLVLVLIPGFGATLLVYPPERVGLPARAALSFGFGYAVAAMTSFALALFGLLNPLVFLASITAVSVALWYFGLKRGSLRHHFASMAAEIRADPLALGGGLAVLLGIAILRSTIDPLWNLPGAAGFRYWGDATEIADAGAFPELSLQYGRLYPPAISKLLLNCFNAGVITIVGSEALAGMAAVLWTASVGMAVAMWAVGRELGLRYFAPLLPVVTMSNQVVLNREISEDLQILRAENVGRMIAFCVVVAGIVTLKKRRGWIQPLLVGTLATVAATTHLIALLVGMLMLGCYAFGRILRDAHRIQTLLRALAIPATGVIITAALFLVVPGSVGFEGASDTQQYELIDGRFDPTRFLSGQGALETPAEVRMEDSGRSIPDTFVASALGRDTGAGGPSGGGLFPLLVVGGLVIAATMLIWFPPELRYTALVGWGTSAGLVVATIVMTQRSDLQVLTTFGARRMFDYSTFAVLLVLLGLVEAAVGLLTRSRPLMVSIAATLAVLVITALVIPSVQRAPAGRGSAAGKGELRLLNWLRENIPCDDRLLANQRTTGVFKVITGRVALAEGMAPYLRPRMLQEVVSLLLEARDFYRDPTKNLGLLEREAIDYVIILGKRRWGFSYGARGVRTLPPAPFLQPVFRSEGVQVFEVSGLSEGNDRPDASTSAGYDCKREPVA
jgi:hypothetical protein